LELVKAISVPYLSCSWEATTEVGRGDPRKGVRDASRVLRVWDFSQKYLYRLAALGLPLGAIAEAVSLRGCNCSAGFGVF